MLVAALVSFALLFLAWLVAPGPEPASRPAGALTTADHGAPAPVPVEIR